MRPMKVPHFLFALPLIVATATANAAAVKDREGAVRQDKAAMENDARWAYNDVDRGFAEAKRTGNSLAKALKAAVNTAEPKRPRKQGKEELGPAMRKKLLALFGNLVRLMEEAGKYDAVRPHMDAIAKELKA